MMERTPIEAWLARKLGCNAHNLSREALWRYQKKRIVETLEWALDKSLFYQRHFKGLRVRASDWPEAWTELPFTSALDLQRHGSEFLCVSQSEISRIVTMDTSGTTGQPKRLYFTGEDQAAIIDFFAAGLSTFAGRGDRVLILLPGERPGSVGDLIAKALERIEVEPIAHGWVRDPVATLRTMQSHAVTSLVGVPVQILALARWETGESFPLNLNSVLLSTDSAAPALIQTIENKWHCRVFDHYGMTEMGLGGGVDCTARSGYHLREADLYFEVVDPTTGRPVPEGEAGEVVFTTLTRKGMPLIRYRTGDLSCFLPEPCSCGSTLRRLEHIKGRAKESPQSLAFSMSDMDATLFGIPSVIDFSIRIVRKEERPQIDIKLLTTGCASDAENEARKRLVTLAAARGLEQKQAPSFVVRAEVSPNKLVGAVAKRTMEWTEE